MGKQPKQIMLLLLNQDVCDFLGIKPVQSPITVLNSGEVLNIVAACEGLDVQCQASQFGIILAVICEGINNELMAVEQDLADLEQLLDLAQNQPEKVSSYLDSIDDRKKGQLIKALMYQLLSGDLKEV